MSDSLFQLIHTLDRKEKAHFSKYAGMSKSDAKFLQLYQAINKMAVYDEEKLRKKFRTAFDSLKSDLYGKILDALTDFHKADSEKTYIHQVLVLLPVLYQKRLWHPFQQRLKRAKEQAEAGEHWAILYDLLDWEKRYLRKSKDNKGLREKFDLIYQKQNRCTAALQEETKWEHIYLQLNLILKHDHRLLKIENQKRFEKLGNIPEPDTTKLPSFKALFYYCRGRNVYYRHTGQPEKALVFAQTLTDVFASKKEHSSLYVDALCSLSRAYDALECFDEQGEIVQKLKQLPQYKDEADILVFEKACNMGMRYYLNTTQFEAAAQLADDVYVRWEQMKQQTQPFQQQLYCYNFIITYWILADYKKALFWMAIVLEYKFTPEGKNYLIGARLLELMLYYDYKPENLDTRLDSIRRVLKHHWETGEYEKSVFSFFGQLTHKANDEHSVIFQDFYPVLAEYAQKRFIASHEMLYWVRSKINGETLRAIVEAR